MARFVQADTVVPEPGNPQDLNRYTYTRNNPLRYTDPSGNCPFGILGCLAALDVGTRLVVNYFTWHQPSRTLAATSEQSPFLFVPTYAASVVLAASYERDIQDAASKQMVPTDILRAAVRQQALGSTVDWITTDPELNRRRGKSLEDVSVGLGQIKLSEAQEFRRLGFIDFEPTVQNIRDPHNSIMLLAAKLRTVDTRIEELSHAQGLPVSQSDRRQLLMIGQNEGTSIVELYFKHGGDWEAIFHDNPWARFQLEAGQRRILPGE